MFKKLILTILAVILLAPSAYAHGGHGYDRGYDGDGLALSLGILGGLAIGGAMAQQSYYPQYGYQYYSQGTRYMFRQHQFMRRQQCTNYVQQILVNGYLTNIYRVACLDQYGRWVTVQ